MNTAMGAPEWPTERDLAYYEAPEQTQEIPGHPISDVDTAPALPEQGEDTPEVDPLTVPLYAGMYLRKGGFGIESYHPEPLFGPKRGEYDVPSTPEGDRLTARLFRLLGSREFARTGVLPPEGTVPGDRDETQFYIDLYNKWGITADGKTNVGTVLVWVDGYSVLSLGIDGGDNRNQKSFAAKGGLSAQEVLRRARVVFPDIFENMVRVGNTIAEEPREIIDLQ